MCPVSSTLPSQNLPRRRLRPLILGAPVLALFTLLAAPSAPAGRAQGGRWLRHACTGCVRALAQTDDALWVATLSGGLLRYDLAGGAPRRYTTADGLAGDAISELAVGRDGQVWVANRLGPIGPGTGLSHFDGRRWTRHTVATGLPDANINDIAVGPGGTVWVAAGSGPAHYDGTTWRLYTTADGLPSSAVSAVALGTNGEAWASTDRGLARFDGSRWSVVPHDRVAAETVFSTLAVGSDGTVWAGSKMDDGVASFHPAGLPDGTHWTIHAFNGPPRPDPVSGEVGSMMHRIKVDAGGGVWVAGTLTSPEDNVHVQVAHWDGREWTLSNHRNPGHVTVVEPGIDGRVWVGQISGGLRYGDGQGWHLLPSGGGPTNYVPFAVTTAPNGDLWTGFFSGLDQDNLVNRYDGRTWTRYSSADGMLRGRILGVKQQSIDADVRGTVWVGVDGVGIAWFDVRGWHSKLLEDLLPSLTSIHAVTGDDRGGVWVATGAGALHFDGRTWRRYTTADGLISDAVLAVAVDRRGGRERIWFGTGGGVSAWEGGRWTSYDKADGLGMDLVSAIAVDPVHDAVWFGSGRSAKGGLTRFDGHGWRRFSMADGLPADDFWAIEAGPNGDLWAVGQDDGEGPGIARFDGARWTTYTRADGLMDDAAFDVAIDHKGTVWVATIAGVSEFHPDLAPTPTPAPSPTPGGPCVCQRAREAAPPAVLAAALADPASVAGWRQPLDPNKPVSRFNPLRECLSLSRQAVPYHPLYNPLAWRVGCP